MERNRSAHAHRAAFTKGFMVPGSASQRVWNRDEFVRFGREIPRVSGGEPEFVVFGEGGLESVGEFPSVFAAEARGEVGDGLRHFEEWIFVEEFSFVRGIRVEAGEDFGSSAHGDHSLGSRLPEVFRRFGNAVEMVNEDHGVEQNPHGRWSHSSRIRI